MADAILMITYKAEYGYSTVYDLRHRYHHHHTRTTCHCAGADAMLIGSMRRCRVHGVIVMAIVGGKEWDQ
jgi:hypothetical protein